MTHVRLINEPGSGRVSLSNLIAGDWLEWLGSSACVVYTGEDVEGVLVAMFQSSLTVSHLTADTKVLRIEAPTRVTVEWRA